MPGRLGPDPLDVHPLEGHPRVRNLDAIRGADLAALKNAA
jgi:hypothetical protein